MSSSILIYCVYRYIYLRTFVRLYVWSIIIDLCTQKFIFEVRVVNTITEHLFMHDISYIFHLFHVCACVCLFNIKLVSLRALYRLMDNTYTIEVA